MSAGQAGDWEVAISDLQRSEVLGRVQELRGAFAIAERFVARRRAHAIALVERSRAWRSQPASDRQLALIRKAGIAVEGALTKGQAFQMVAMLGAVGRRGVASPPRGDRKVTKKGAELQL